MESVPKRGKGHRYVRFQHAREPYGVFSYLSDARAVLTEPDRHELRTIKAWFDEHLDEPECMIPVRPTLRRGNPVRDPEPTAVCWFRAAAKEHVHNARRLSFLVLRARIPIVERWVDRLPGQLCSEDEFQLAIASFWD